MAERIEAVANVVIMCGAGCRGAAELLRALSDHLKAPLVHSVRGKDIMAYDDPRWMGGLGMIGTKAVYNAVQHCDLLLMIGTDYPYSNFLPAKGNVIQIDERPMVLGRRTPTALGVTGSARPTLKLLLEKVKAKTNSRFFENVARERVKWDEMLEKQSDPTRSRDKLHPQAVARAVSDLAKDDATFVFDTGLNTLWSGNWIRQNGSQRIIGSFNNRRSAPRSRKPTESRRWTASGK
jgi:pyruvate dehydrogenase (quinone)